MMIKGVHIHGMKGAKRSLKRQKKAFAKLGLPGAKEFFHGTINIDTSPFEYTIVKFDFLFRDVKHKSFPRKRIEDFGFIEILELVHNNIRYEKWGYLYVPHKSPHFNTHNMFEMVGPELRYFERNGIFEIKINEGRLKIRNNNGSRL